jgi:hypothetical protein
MTDACNHTKPFPVVLSQHTVRVFLQQCVRGHMVAAITSAATCTCTLLSAPLLLTLLSKCGALHSLNLFLSNKNTQLQPCVFYCYVRAYDFVLQLFDRSGHTENRWRTSYMTCDQFRVQMA